MIVHHFHVNALTRIKENREFINQLVLDFEMALDNRLFVIAGKRLGEIGRIVIWGNIDV